MIKLSYNQVSPPICGETIKCVGESKHALVRFTSTIHFKCFTYLLGSCNKLFVLYCFGSVFQKCIGLLKMKLC